MDIDWYSKAVCLNDKVYFSSKDIAKLSIYTPATDTWDTILTPVYNFALTTYRSQIVLVGGINYDDESPSVKLWTLSEDGQWQETLPPMETACINASAVSHGDDLLVIDGCRNDVKVYNGFYWKKAAHLPEVPSIAHSIVLNDNLYVIGSYYSKVYSASLDSLIASCHPSETTQPSSAWKKLPDVADIYCYPTVFGRRLTIIGLSGIFAYSSPTKSWIKVGDSPYDQYLLSGYCAIGLPSNELMVIHNNRNVSKVTIKSKCSEVYIYIYIYIYI